jgi:hypothetical protein
LEDLVESGDVAGPVAKQLAASAQQAAKAMDGGDASKAGQAISHFAKFLDQQKKPDRVSDVARTVLDHQAGNILRTFEG